MSRLKQICPQSILMMIYNTLSLNYGILLWGAKVKKDQKLHLLQKKSMRIITSQHYRSHSEPIFKNLGLLMVHDLCSGRTRQHSRNDCVCLLRSDQYNNTR